MPKSDAWIYFLSQRRGARVRSADPRAAEYVPLTWSLRADGVRVPVVKDDVVVPDRGDDLADLSHLVDEDTDITDAEVDVGCRCHRLPEATTAPDCTDGHPQMLSYVSVVGGTIKNRPTAENVADGQPRRSPAKGTPVEGAPFVIIVDTGLAAAAVGRSEDAAQPNRTDDWAGRFELKDDDDHNLDLLDVLSPDGLDLAAGHGTFVAGLIGQVTPARIVMIRAFDTDGVASDRALARAIRRAGAMFEREAGGRGVLNLSCGLETADDNEPPVLRAALDALPPEVVVVAAAGNENSGIPLWPAASKRVLAVGALDGDGRPAPWSNRGPWVDFSTRGVGVVAPYVSGTETRGTGCIGDPFDVDPDTFPAANPFATWEGSSFSAAQVTGEVANKLIADEVPSRSHVPALLRAEAVGPHIPGCGYPLTIL